MDSEPPTSQAVRRFLLGRGLREHNHATEIARIIEVDRSQAYRRLKGEVAWSVADLRAIALRHGAPAEALLPPDELPRAATAPAEAVPAAVRVPRLPPVGLLVPGRELGAGESSDLVAVPGAGGWEVWLDGEEPAGARRHAIESISLRSRSFLQVALLEADDAAAGALAGALRVLGIAMAPFSGGAALLESAEGGRFDAFVLDWPLAGGAGTVPLVERIRARQPHVPLIVLTAALAVDHGLERELYDLSARWNFSTLDKPVRPMHLANALRQLVSASKRA